jgi:hypothetical protein
LNPHAHYGHWILNPARLPIPPLRHTCIVVFVRLSCIMVLTLPDGLKVHYSMKPSKPYPDFPLTVSGNANSNGQWSKKMRGDGALFRSLGRLASRPQ